MTSVFGDDKLLIV